MEVCQAVESSGDEALREKFHTALACVQRTLELYGAGGVAFSFNGGKDSTVLLHIIRAAVASLRASLPDLTSDSDLGGICTFIFERHDDFPEILEFVRTSNAAYRLGVEELDGDFKSGLNSLLARRPIKAVVIGTRRGDPNAGGQDVFCPSSRGWPPFMRVNPILDWSYSDVWTFLRLAGVPYCPLYDRGYTSVGSTQNTLPNSCLQKGDGSFAPAYMLADNRMERSGRVAPGTPKGDKSPAFTRSAILIIIGDEILSGKVGDENAQFLCRELFSLGWRVCKVVTIPDEAGVISEEVHAASEACDAVITTGGVGPTVDDVTMAGVARALGHPLTHNPDLESRLRDYFGQHITEAHLKMAEAPAEEVEFIESVQEDGRPSPFPIIHCRNVFVLPGIPSLLQQKWKAVKEELTQVEVIPRFHAVALRLSLRDETQVAPALNAASLQHTTVSIGSYPVSQQPDGVGIVLALESKHLGALEAAREHLLQQLPASCLVSEERDPRSLSQRRGSLPGSLGGSPSRSGSVSNLQGQK